MIVNDLDFGGAHPYAAPQLGQVIGNALVEGGRTILWPRGRAVEKQDVTFYAQAWQGLGGQTGYLALRYLLRQLEELAGNPDLQPCFIQWAATAESGQYNVTTPHDGWYTIENVQPDYENFVVGNLVKTRFTAQHVAAATPSSLSAWYSGAALSSTYTGAATPLVAFPLGSSGAPPTALSRTGAEGAIPLSLSPTPNPVPFIRPSTIAGLWQGGVRVLDTINTGSNPVPTSGGFTNSNWVQVYGTQHDFVGDCILTNGLLLLLFQVGQGQLCTVYVWNTSLGTPAWQSIGTVQYFDGVIAGGTLREINIDRVGLEEARVRVRSSTSGGNWAEHRLKLQRGCYHAGIQFQPITQPNSTNLGLEFAPASAVKIIYDDSGVQDLSVTSGGLVAPSAALGFGAMFGTAANGPLFGFLYQNAPSTGQPVGNGTASVGFGDSNGPSAGTWRQYGVFALPFTTVPNLQAEAESGSLGTGWSSVADAAASAGNAAKVASGTASGNADLFGTSWVPPAGLYVPWFRVRVTSAASTTAQMQIGLWDTTAGAFVALASTIYAPSQWGTSYVWASPCFRVTAADVVFNSTTTITSNSAIFTSADVGKLVLRVDIPTSNLIPPGTTIASVTNNTTAIMSAAATASGGGVTISLGAVPVTPTAGDHMQFRAAATATLTTDFFVDEAVLVPIRSATLGLGNFPGDLFSQFLFDANRAWVRG